MAKGRKTGGRDFIPGVVTNPNGRPKLPPELLELRKLTRGDVELLVLRYKRMTKPELEALVKKSDTPAEDIVVIRVILRGIATGDPATLAFMTDFIFGASPKKYEIKGDVGLKVAHIDPKETAEAIKQLNDEF